MRATPVWKRVSSRSSSCSSRISRSASPFDKAVAGNSADDIASDSRNGSSPGSPRPGSSIEHLFVYCHPAESESDSARAWGLRDGRPQVPIKSGLGLPEKRLNMEWFKPRASRTYRRLRERANCDSAPRYGAACRSTSTKRCPDPYAVLSLVRDSDANIGKLVSHVTGSLLSFA